MVLGDPVTQVIQQEIADIAFSTVYSSHESQPTCQLTPDGILVITIHEYQHLADWSSAAQKIGAAKTEIPKACGILVDLRASAPPGVFTSKVVTITSAGGVTNPQAGRTSARPTPNRCHFLDTASQPIWQTG